MCQLESCKKRRACVSKKMYLWLKLEIQKIKKRDDQVLLRLLKERRYRHVIRSIKYPNQSGCRAWVDIAKQGFYPCIAFEHDKLGSMDDFLNWNQENPEHLIRCEDPTHNVTPEGNLKIKEENMLKFTFI